MPELVQNLTDINSMRYFLVIRVFLEGDGMTDLWSQYWPLPLIALVTMNLVAWIFRHRYHKRASSTSHGQAPRGAGCTWMDVRCRACHKS